MPEAHRETFRVAEFNIESNHLHLIIEAASSAARASGMKGLEVRLAKRINAASSRTGRVFADRYHARTLTTPREVRHALRYVLNNARHHDPHVSLAFGDGWIDPCSSAPWFDGWARPIDTTVRWKRELVQQPAPTVKARSWLLSVGWRRHGAIDFDEVPGPRSERRRAH